MRLILPALALLAGCNFKYHSVPNAPLPFASVDYTVMGATSAEECGTYVFGIDFGHLFVDQQGGGYGSGGGGSTIADLISSLLPGSGGPPEAGRAMYAALEKMPEATNLYAPKVHTTTVGFAPFEMPIFAQRCSEVEARGVRLGKGPVPNAN